VTPGIHQRTITPTVIMGLALCCALVAPLFGATSRPSRDRIVLPNGRPVNVGAVPQAHVDPHTITVPVVDGNGMRFTRLSTEDGLSQTRVTQIVQDDQGFIWFASEYGLNRYDGYKFKVFKHEPGRPNSLGGVYIYSLFKDHSGVLWIGCERCVTSA
jgi:ligand-binding sensor domain-containing protein